MLTILAWSIARRDEAWRYPLNTDADIALLQEAASPPVDIGRRLMSIRPLGEQMEPAGPPSTVCQAPKLEMGQAFAQA